MPVTVDEEKEIAAFRLARERFLKEAYPEEYARMQKEGTLEASLQETALEAKEMFDLVVRQVRDEALARPGKFQQTAEAIRNAPVMASELVAEELIQTPPS